MYPPAPPFDVKRHLTTQLVSPLPFRRRGGTGAPTPDGVPELLRWAADPLFALALAVAVDLGGEVAVMRLDPTLAATVSVLGDVLGNDPTVLQAWGDFGIVLHFDDLWLENKSKQSNTIRPWLRTVLINP